MFFKEIIVFLSVLQLLKLTFLFFAVSCTFDVKIIYISKYKSGNNFKFYQPYLTGSFIKLCEQSIEKEVENVYADRFCLERNFY